MFIPWRLRQGPRRHWLPDRRSVPGADTDGDASSVAATSAAPLATKRSTVDAALAEVAGLAGRPQPRPEF